MSMGAAAREGSSVSDSPQAPLPDRGGGEVTALITPERPHDDYLDPPDYTHLL